MARTFGRSVAVSAVSSMLVLVAAAFGITIYAMSGQRGIEIPAVYSATFSQTEASVAVQPGLLGLFLAMTVSFAFPVALVLRAQSPGHTSVDSAWRHPSRQSATSVEDTVEEGEDRPILNWRPGGLTITVWMVLSVPLTVFGILVFGLIYAAANGGGGRIEFDSGGFWFALVVLLAVMVVHEFVHGLAMRYFGASPVYGAGVIKKVMPYLSCTAPGHRFSKKQFAVVGLAPAVVFSAAGAPWVAFGPYGGWIAVVMGAHLAGCIGDFWMVTLAALQPQHSRIEDTGAGMRVWKYTPSD